MRSRLANGRCRGGTTVSTFQGVLMFALATLAWLAVLARPDPVGSAIDFLRRLPWLPW